MKTRVLNPKHATPQQVADHLGLDVSQVLRWEKSGILTPNVREGRVVRFDLEEVKATLAKRAAEKREAKAKGASR